MSALDLEQNKQLLAEAEQAVKIKKDRIKTMTFRLSDHKRKVPEAMNADNWELAQQSLQQARSLSADKKQAEAELKVQDERIANLKKAIKRDSQQGAQKAALPNPTPPPSAPANPPPPPPPAPKEDEQPKEGQ
jgi:hypothetical protein